MEALTLQLQRNNEETIECWDDDNDLECTDDTQFRIASSATSVTNSSLVRRSGHRDSISSRRSARSDLDSNAGTDEDWQVLLHDNDDAVTEDAIASAKNAGIPIPTNVPKSALVGGTIKRLGKRKPKKNFVDDWSEDVEFPGPGETLQLKPPQESLFPDTLRTISSAVTSPIKAPPSPFWDDDHSTRLHSALTRLDQFREEDTSDAQAVPTIKAAKPWRSQEVTIPQDGFPFPGAETESENFDADFDLPADNLKLQLTTHKDVPRVLGPAPETFDVDWSEGSIGIRFGGTTRDHRSNPSSSVSIASPSVSSYLTGESEDDGIDGIIIPAGPLDLEAKLKKRQSTSHAGFAGPPNKTSPRQPPPDIDDFLSGLDVENDDAFAIGKLSLNPNIKRKSGRPGSPARRLATTITFTNTKHSPKTRIPRLSGHDRHSTHLETVSESGAPIFNFRRPQSRLGSHTSHSSVSSCPPSAIPVTPPHLSTPSRRSTGARTSRDPFISDNVSSSTKRLKPKRSMPAMRNTNSSGSTPPFQQPPSRLDGTSRIFQSSVRPKTPVDRIDIRSLSRRSQVPFIPAGASENQSHHVNFKTYGYSRRTNSDSSGDIISQGSSSSRKPRFSRSEPIGSSLQDRSPETTFAGMKRTLTRPTRRRNFGDGTELESLDDLPTSASAESRFVKYPTSHGVPRSFRSRLSQNQNTLLRTESPAQSPDPPTGGKPRDSIPRFARDTTASRNAREQRIASMTLTLKNRERSSLASISTNWKDQVVSRSPSTSLPMRSKRGRTKATPTKPHLIKPMGAGVQEAKSVKGMRYNPATFQWEGNENSIIEFEPATPKSPRPAPALITNIGTMQNVQVVGGMVFDPRRMCWLKMAPSQPGDSGVLAVQDEDDVFSGLDDLQENGPKTGNTAGGRTSNAFDELGPTASGDDRSPGESSDEWPMTEEFDVGPEFIKRQRAEEEKWRRKVDKWITSDRRTLEYGWRWAIRDLVRVHGVLRSQSLDDP
ncbi:hypothetical protein ASPZODRAFT_70838 [Penicilliopsis zonata CBS 506.65]|uniref:Cytokinesis regulator (Byr4) n=1 Tax=Penicilliopsis zonata CBS 506.65 TaxID=1073090 RepID=A0A1L9SCG3_9EURO|nr:hypothetical protein ASPZODRAFT_70838 [Penicilliopsis zonata CBS 506.65]OJJ44844.1 hypothetical protein ASPZODRAFT_70838 [Penicilliopsis zonata CBS 506.65]